MRCHCLSEDFSINHVVMAFSLARPNYGVGAGTGRRLVFVFRGGGVVLRLFEFGLTAGVAVRIALLFRFGVARLALPFWFRVAFAFAFALSFLGVGLFLGVGVGLAEELELAFVFLFSVDVFAFVFAGSAVSPVADPRLMSTATVCPTFTITPAWGS
jgi:hypothetical protein